MFIDFNITILIKELAALEPVVVLPGPGIFSAQQEINLPFPLSSPWGKDTTVFFKGVSVNW